MTRWTRCLLTALLLILASSTTSAAQQQVGTIVGQVLRADSRAPLVGAQVVVVGTTLGALTAAEGRFIIRSVPAGSRTVRVPGTPGPNNYGPDPYGAHDNLEGVFS